MKADYRNNKTKAKTFQRNKDWYRYEYIGNIGREKTSQARMSDELTNISVTEMEEYCETNGIELLHFSNFKSGITA